MFYSDFLFYSDLLLFSPHQKTFSLQVCFALGVREKTVWKKCKYKCICIAHDYTV